MNDPATTEAETAIDMPPPPADDSGKKAKKKDRETEPSVLTSTDRDLREIFKDENRALREVMEALGAAGSFSIKISRKDPEFVRDAAGRPIPTRGYLETVDHGIDETWILNKYGGGTYELYCRKKDGKYGGHRTVKIAGEPSLVELPRSVPGTAVQAATNASSAEPSMAKQALEMAAESQRRAEERADKAAEKAAAGGGVGDVMLQLLRDELKEAREAKRLSDERHAEEMREIRATMSAKPEPTAESKFTEKLLDKMMDGESAALDRVRAQHQAEINTLKERHVTEMKLLEDRHERTLERIDRDHQRQLDLLTTTHNATIKSMETTNTVVISSKDTTHATTKEILQAENRKLVKDNDELREEVKELRAKKDKSITEMLTEVDKIKELVGGGDDGDQSAFDKVISGIASPEGLSAVEAMVNRIKGGGQPAQQQQAQAAPAKPRVARDSNGQRFIVDGNTITPVKKPKAANEDPQLPDIDADTVKLVVGYLERAHAAGTEPEIVAQSGRASVPEPVLASIRDLGGVDVFLAKVAKLPSSSPLLSTQSARNWVRKVGKALLGDDK